MVHTGLVGHARARRVVQLLEGGPQRDPRARQRGVDGHGAPRVVTGLRVLPTVDGQPRQLLERFGRRGLDGQHGLPRGLRVAAASRARGGESLLEGGAYLAFADAEGWQPIGPQAADPRPFYLIWKHPTQRELSSHPRPFQLVSIERIDAAAVARQFPDAAPRVAADTPAARGFALFRARCIACHAMNRDGGRIGPDLNVPQSITEYRPAAQIRAYIREPRTFRYGNMPSHRDLSDVQLDELLAYFEVMRSQKHDPAAGAAAPTDTSHGGSQP